jgi:uroporphyrinogen decarboxylase
MTKKEAFINALELGEPVGRVPHFELVFFLTMEAFGKVHPAHRFYGQWNQMSEKERSLQRRDMAKLYIQTAERFEHYAIFVHNCRGWGELATDEMLNVIAEIRNLTGDEYYIMIHGDATFAIPDGDSMVEFSMQMADQPQQLKDQAKQQVEDKLKLAEKIKKAGLLDGFALCADYALNAGPFLSPTQFDEFVTPYLAELIASYRGMDFYTIKHTDGNIMPILDSIVSANPHALHSLDPQGGIDIAEIKKKLGRKLCLIGNVNCGLMDTGTEQQVKESAEYAIENAMPGGGYIFSTSNCIYTGMDLQRYEMILDIWREKANYH